MRINPMRGRVNYIIGHNFLTLPIANLRWLLQQTSDTLKQLSIAAEDILPIKLTAGYLNGYYTTFFVTISQVPAGRSHMRHILRVYAYTHTTSYSKCLVYEETSDLVAGTCCDLEASMSYLMRRDW